ncbi:hypothetical protein [Kitasatospora sp. NPDC088351]|uniref:hypothetical protein n=1 Tax=Kitasatospora sp. NPDC088351 TaxID=3155180 RepID=UPI003418E679
MGPARVKAGQEHHADQLRKRTAELDLPKIGLHALRRTAASIVINADIPLAITINLYSHLLKDSANGAVKALASALDRADAQLMTLTQPGRSCSGVGQTCSA